MKTNYRTFQPDDTDELIRLFQDTVHFVNSRDYSPELIEAWAPEDIDSHNWKRRLERNYSVVAANSKMILGFGELSIKGVIDTLYVHKDHQRQGIGSGILKMLENEAYQKEYKTLRGDVSLTARPFFLKHDFRIVEEQEKFFNGLWFVNYLMEKDL